MAELDERQVEPEVVADPKVELQRTIISAMASVYDDAEATLERMSYILPKVQDEFMEGKLYPLWKVAARYFPMTGGVPSPAQMDEILESSVKLSISEKLELSNLYKELAGQETSPIAYRIACQRIQERWRDDKYTATLAHAQRIHLAGDGKQVGFADSMDYLRDEVAKIERLSTTEDMREGDINLEAADFIKEYLNAKEGKSSGVLTGFTELDDLSHGMQPGELWLCAGFTGEGKSKIAYNVAYSAAYLQGKNVLFGTNESTRAQVRRNLICRHSRHPKFKIPTGLRYSDIKFGTLNKEGEEVLRMVLADMKTGGYGKCYVFQMPHRVTPDYVSEVIYRQSRIYHIDLIVVDYLGYMTSQVRRLSEREELNDLLKSMKTLAVSTSLPIFSPWQISREAWREAQKTGEYTKAALSDTSQAERATDLVMSILKKDDEPDTLKCQVLKFRDGETGLKFDLATDFTTSYIASKLAHHQLLEQLE